MADWLSRALTRFAAQPAPPSVQPLPEAELRKAVESAKRTMTEGDFAAARAALREVATSNPDDADALAHYGVAAYMRVTGRCAGRLSRAVQIDPDHVIGHKYLAASYNALGICSDLKSRPRTRCAWHRAIATS